MPIKSSIAIVGHDASTRAATGLLRALGFISDAFLSADEFFLTLRACTSAPA
jgi:hypothetical protein